MTEIEYRKLLIDSVRAGDYPEKDGLLELLNICSLRFEKTKAIENNIRKKVIETVTVNPRYYAKMSEILDKLIEERKQGVLDYAEMLEKYIKLAKDVDCPEDNDKYPESIRKSKALMAIYDNTGEDEKLALRIHKAVKKQALSGFRDNQVVVRRIKKALFEILGDDSEVERIYKIIEKQEEY